jgi:hypothetical protein
VVLSTDLFIPTFWSNLILHRLKISLAYASPYCVNHDYEGEIQGAGDTVAIHGISDPTISDYVKNVDMADPETLDDWEQKLLIDQAKMWNFQVDDIDKKQAQPQFVSEAMDRAGYELGVVADQHVAALMLASAVTGTDPSGESVAGITGTVTVPIPISIAFTTDPSTPKEAAYEFLVDLGVVLDNQKIPRSNDRFAVVPPWFLGLLSKDVRFTGYGGASGNSVIADGFAGQADQNGLAGRAAGFNVIMSLDVPGGAFDASGGGYKSSSGTAPYHAILAGVPQATSFANQIVETEAFRSHKRFGDVLRGLHVYGTKVVWPSRLAAAYVAPGA